MIPGMNAKQMKKMERQMKKMGMDMKDLKGVKEVIIRLEDKELVIPNAEVRIDEELVIPDEDIEMVANQANVSEDEAKAALEDTNGDLAEAILKLNQ